jgi:hypothetical protein
MNYRRRFRSRVSVVVRGSLFQNRLRRLKRSEAESAMWF